MLVRHWLPSLTAGLFTLLVTILGTAGSGLEAWAQTKPDDKTKSTTVRANPLQNGGMLMQADSIVYDTDNEIITAVGKVEVTYEGRTLLADEISYEQQIDRVVARGNVSLMEPSGEVLFADEAVLTDQLRQGVIDGFGALLDQNVTIAADKAYRKDEGDTHELTRAVYTACDVCDDNDKPKTPLWRIKSFRVIHDREERVIIMRDVYFEIFGSSKRSRSR